MTIGRAINEQQLDVAVAAIGCARLQLADPLEAAVVAESLGYTDGRVRRELGLSDVYELGQTAFELLADRPLPIPERRPRRRRPSLWPAAGFIVPWLAVLAIDRAQVVPGPPLGLAFMLSLVAMGGFVVALRERGHFYATHGRPSIAASVAAYVVRVGIVVAVTLAVTGVLVGRILDVASWPVLVLWADEFFVFSALWLAYGGWGARRLAEQGAGPEIGSPAPLPLPRLTVVLAHMLPSIARASACLAVAFAGPLLLAGEGTRAASYAAATVLLFAMGAVYRKSQAEGQAAPNSRAPSL